MQLQALAAFEDNYIWMLSQGTQAWVVDPGDAGPVLHHLDKSGLSLIGVLVTHHHGDHTGGVAQLQQAIAGLEVYAPAGETFRFAHQPVREGDAIDVLGCTFKVIDIPGHTAGHVAYVGQPEDQEPLLFCGDTLFYGGCGRLFEGSPEQMWTSLQRLAALEPSTRVCCAHEYTLANLRFALAVEPDNEHLQQAVVACNALRAQSLPTLPSTIARELAINPFLRVRDPQVRASARHHAPALQEPAPDSSIFAALREWKNNF